MRHYTCQVKDFAATEKSARIEMEHRLSKTIEQNNTGRDPVEVGIVKPLVDEIANTSV